jgi:hypothetical protein
MVTDVVGYSRLVGKDEEGTRRAFRHAEEQEPHALYGIHWFVTKLWLACEVCSVEALRSISYELASRIWGFERERAAP